MKKNYLLGLIVLVSMQCVFISCEKVNIEPITEKYNTELYSFGKNTISYIELQQQIDSLRQKYNLQHNTIQTRGIKNFWTHLFLTAWIDAKGFLYGKSHWGGNTGGIICSALSSISYVSKGYKTIDLIIDKVGKFEIKSSPDVNYGSSGLLDEDQYGVLHNKIAKEFFNDSYVREGRYLESDLVRRMSIRMVQLGYQGLNAKQQEELTLYIKNQRKLSTMEAFVANAQQAMPYYKQELDMLEDYVTDIIDMEKSSDVRAYTIDFQNTIKRSSIPADNKSVLCISISIAENSNASWEPKK